MITKIANFLVFTGLPKSVFSTLLFISDNAILYA